jgi:hypothetical protein
MNRLDEQEINTSFASAMNFHFAGDKLTHQYVVAVI